MENFYDFNDDFDGTAGSFRQPTMQQPNDSSGLASASLASAPSAVSSAMVRRNKQMFAAQMFYVDVNIF